MGCTKREELTAQASQALEQVKSLIEQEISVLHQGNQSKMLSLDKDLEHAVGEKERAFGALTEHTKEHGC